MMILRPIYIVFLMLLCWSFVACDSSSSHVGDGVFQSEEQVVATEVYDLPEIQETGELIVLTLYGPITYFEYRGERFGSQYLLADKFAHSIGVTTRVEVCRSADEMLRKLEDGEGDLIAVNLQTTDSLPSDLRSCGERELTELVDTLAAMDKSVVGKRSGDSCCWLVRSSSPELERSLSGWLQSQRPNLLALSMPKLETEEGDVYLPRRHAASPMRNPAKGEISVYDALFKQYASRCGWDWRLLAAQAYQESAFDARAVSWMGACGLLQLMPSTARQMGVNRRDIFNAERNVAGAVKFLSQLSVHYAGISHPDHRINFILAAYNAGPGHVDDARSLARKYGHNPNNWNEVEPFVLRMSESRFYNDPVVRHGYFRGNETYNYVRDIRARWNEYKKKIR